MTNTITTTGDPTTDTDNTQPEPRDLDATTAENLPQVVAAMLTNAYRAKGIEAPLVTIPAATTDPA